MDETIEQAARRLGMWSTMAPASDDCWRIEPRFGLSGPWQVWRWVAALPTTVSGARLDSPTAALWLMMLGMPDVAVTCPDCLARSATKGSLARWEWRKRWTNVSWLLGTGWDMGPLVGAYRRVSRPCPTCTVDGQPIGRVQREPARVLLDAMVKGDRVIVTPGASRDALAVLADQLQTIGDQRGEWLALWLAGPDTLASVLGDVEVELRALAMRLALAEVRAEYGDDARVVNSPGFMDARFCDPSHVPDGTAWAVYIGANRISGHYATEYGALMGVINDTRERHPIDRQQSRALFGSPLFPPLFPPLFGDE